jgi:hypothetical protein
VKRTNRFDFLKVLLAVLLVACMALPPMPSMAQTSSKTYRDATGGFLNETTFLPSAAYTTSSNTITPIDVGGYDVGIIIINVTAVSGTTPSLTVNFNGCDSAPGSQTFPANSACALHTASAAITATGVFFIKVDHLTKFVTVQTVITGTSPSFTMTIRGQFKTSV